MLAVLQAVNRFGADMGGLRCKRQPEVPMPSSSPVLRRSPCRRIEPDLCRGDLDESLPDWIGAHVRAGLSGRGAGHGSVGQPQSRGDEGLFPRAELNDRRRDGGTLRHRGDPARPRKPRTKRRSSQAAVQLAQRSIDARLRDRRSAIPGRLNAAIREVAGQV